MGGEQHAGGEASGLFGSIRDVFKEITRLAVYSLNSRQGPSGSPSLQDCGLCSLVYASRSSGVYTRI